METLQDDYFEEEEEDTSTKLYLLAWYRALHWESWVSGKVASGLLPDAPEGTLDIVNVEGRGNTAPVSIAWDLKTGEPQPVDSQGNWGTAWLEDEAGGIRRAQAQLQVVANAGIIPGNLSNDPEVGQFFAECGQPVCQVDFPDGIQLQIKYPMVDGILIYRISRSSFKPVPSLTGDPAFSLNNQFLEAAKESFKNVARWIESGWRPKPAGTDNLL